MSYDASDEERRRWLNHLRSYMCSGAERTVRVRNIADRMCVNSLNRPGRNNQEQAKKSEE
jgi:hypothetical protein